MKNHLRLLAVLLIILITSFPVNAFDLSGLVNVIEYKKAKGALSDKFYPLGFSEKGHFCFLRIPADEAVGCFLWNFKIVNLKYEKIEYSTGFKNKDCEIISDLKSLFNEHGILFRKKMIQYNIESSIGKIEKFPFKFNGDNIEADLKKIKKTKVKNGFYRTVYFLIIKSERNGSKIVGKVFEMCSEEIPFVYNSRINGYIMSPLESRVAVVVEQEQRGWEGPPNISKFKLFGASLVKGFKKRKR